MTRFPARWMRKETVAPRLRERPGTYPLNLGGVEIVEVLQRVPDTVLVRDSGKPSSVELLDSSAKG